MFIMPKFNTLKYFVSERIMNTQWVKDLQAKKLKVTPQRIAMLDELKRNGHMDVDEMYENIREFYSSISLATVYKNLGVLCEAGILREVKAPSQKQKYELSCDKHIHASCEKCGKLQDIVIDTSALESAISAKSGFVVYDTSAVFIGICPECLKQGAKKAQ